MKEEGNTIYDGKREGRSSGFKCMELFIQRGFLLKAIIVKNIGETKGKVQSHGLCRYRALANDFYVFGHEYVFVFRKKEDNYARDKEKTR